MLRFSATLAFVAVAALARAETPEKPGNLQPEPPPYEVVVTGTRTPRRTTRDPVGTEVIGAKELQARNVRDASRALEDEPGVQIERSFRGASIQMRGLEAKYVRVMQDGMPLVGQVNDVIDLRRYSMDGIERIEVVRGAASALYGSDALAGVVNLISRRPKRAVEGSGFLQYGSLNGSAAGLYAGTKRGRLGATLTLGWFGNDSYDLTPGDQDLSTSGDARRVGTGSAHLFWEPSENLEIMAFLRFGAIDTRGVDLQPPRALWNRRVGENEYAGGSTATWKLDEATKLTVLAQANAFARSFWRQQRQGPGLDDQHSVESLLRGEAQLDRTVGAMTLTGGAGGQRSELTSPRLENGGAGFSAGFAFVQGEGTFGEWGDLVAGGRVDVDRNYGTHASPRIALRVKLAPLLEGLSLRAGYGQGFRAPSLGERFLDFKNNAANYVVHGNADLKPELSQSFQAGLEWAPPARVSGKVLPTLRFTAYRNELSNLIQPVDTSGGQHTYFQYENYATARIQGLEAALRVIVDRWLTADLGYAWLDARGTLDESGAGSTTERALPGRAGRQWTGALFATRESWGTEVSLRGQYQLRRTPLDAEAVGFAPPLFLADLKLTQRVWKPETGPAEVQVYVSGENLANQTDLTFLMLPGRLVQAGVQGRY